MELPKASVVMDAILAVGFSIISVGLTFSSTSPAKRSGRASLEAESVSDAGDKGGGAMAMLPVLRASLSWPRKFVIMEIVPKITASVHKTSKICFLRDGSGCI